MHELSIVMSVVEIAEKEIKKAKATTVDSIELEIGTQAGVEFDALEFCWNSGVMNSVLAKAKRIITKIQAVSYCPECKYEFDVHEPFQPCPKCNSYLVHLIKGNELRVKSLLVQ